MAKILIVDDEELVRELYGAWLEEEGYEVITAASVQEALGTLKAEDIDTIVSDIRMARQTGIDLLAQVKEHDPDLPVILVTGVPAVESAIEALRLQAYDYMIKPVTETALRRVVGRAVERRHLLVEKRRLEEENIRYQRELERLVAERTAALERRTQHLLILHQISQKIGTLLDEDALLERVAHIVQKTFDYMRVTIYRVDKTANVFRLVAAAGRDVERIPKNVYYPLDWGLLGKALREQKALFANDLQDEPTYRPVPGNVARSKAVLPIFADEELVGLFTVSEDKVDVFDETEQVVLQTLAQYLSIALSNARLYAQVQEALKAREEMLHNVSHELRTPLTIIRGYAELMLEGYLGTLDDEVRAVVETIVQQAKHLSHLVDQLVAFRKLEEQLDLEPIYFSEWLRYVVQTWVPMMQEEHITLKWDVPEDLGIVQGNAHYLTEVMNNLLDNARKFSPPHSTVWVRARRNENSVQVSVQDEGIGVPPEKLDRIFERFYQIEGGTTRRFAGMGLGLALVYEIITRHGGKVWAESQGEGHGLTVTFTLPLALPQEEASSLP